MPSNLGLKGAPFLGQGTSMRALRMHKMKEGLGAQPG